MNEELFLVSARHPSLGSAGEFVDYITTNEDFRRFTSEVFDLTADNRGNELFRQYIRMFQKVQFVGTGLIEDRAVQGIEKVISTSQGDVKIGYSRVRENRIYVECEGKYLRGIKGYWADLCLVNAMDFVPLDKSKGDGNIEILMWNKRKSIKSIKFIHNKVQSILYVVDMELGSEEEVQADMENPKDLNLSVIFEPILRL